MTPEQAKARAQRYDLWYEQDGLKVIIADIRAEYIERIAKLDVTDRDYAAKAKAYAVATKVVDVVDDHIRFVIGSGKLAAKELDRLEKLSKLTKEQRRWL